MAHTKTLIVVGPLPPPPFSTEVTSIRRLGETVGQTGDIVLAPGTNVTIDRTGTTFTFNASGAGGGVPSGSCAGQLLAFDGAANVWAKIVTETSPGVVIGRNGDVVLQRNC